jgi:DNA-binding response OmpR family regulator
MAALAASPEAERAAPLPRYSREEGGSPRAAVEEGVASTILVVDDEKNIVQLARLYLEREGFQVEAAFDGEQALEKARSVRPELVVLDIMLPGMDGLAVCKELRKTSNVPVIILTARGDDVDRVVGLELGADDYVTKPFNPRELVARVKAVLRRSRQEPVDQPVLEADGLRLDAARREVTLEGEAVTLRAKEFDLLAAFMRHQGIVLDRERLLQMVWGSDYFGDTRTIDVHVAWLRDKLAKAKKVKIQTVWGVGYKLVVDADAAQPQ